jgi:MFS transporter, PPP family, 3-phenylpropionic acid transporter
MLLPLMFHLRLQYLLNYAVNGCLIPFVSIYLQQKHLDNMQIGMVMGVAGLAVVLSPVLVTLIADAHLDARKVLAGLLLMTAGSLVVLPLFATFLAILCSWVVTNIVQVPVNPLQDGINFAIQEQRSRSGLKAVPFHRVRVWGTVGFIVPGLALFLLVRRTQDVTIVFYLAAGFAAAAGLNSLMLPPIGDRAAPSERRLPTLEAARVLLGRKMLVFSIASFMLQMASACYYSFYPVYLTKGLGISKEWSAMVMNIGVLGEILFMLAFGRLMGYFGARRFLLVGSAVMLVRMVLLAAVPNPYVAIGTQVCHGAMVLLLQVGPIVLLNSMAEARFRHSLQGLFAMLIMGGGRIVGNFAAGPIARYGYSAAYWWAAALVLAGGVLLAVGYHPEPEGTGAAEAKRDEVVAE